MSQSAGAERKRGLLGRLLGGGDSPSPGHPPLRFDGVLLPSPDGWDGWALLRVTAMNHGPVAAGMVEICRTLRLGGRIVTKGDVARIDAAGGWDAWPDKSSGGKLRCADLREFRVPQASAAGPGTAAFEALILPGRALGRLGYRMRYRWDDRPERIVDEWVFPDMV